MAETTRPEAIVFVLLLVRKRWKGKKEREKEWGRGNSIASAEEGLSRLVFFRNNKPRINWSSLIIPRNHHSVVADLKHRLYFIFFLVTKNKSLTLFYKCASFQAELFSTRAEPRERGGEA